MEALKISFVLASLVLNGVLAQQPTYRQETSQKVQLEDIEQDSLKNTQQSANHVQSAPQYTVQYPSQNSQIVYSVPTQQSQHVAPAQTASQQAASYPLFTIPSQATPGALPGQQHYIYYMQPQQLSPYDVPFFGGGYSFVPQAPQTVLPGNVNVNDLYKTLQQQTTSGAAGKAGATVKTAAPQIPPNYYFTPLPQTYYSPVHIPQVPVSNAGAPQYVAYNSFYPSVQTAQKSVYSAGVKSTTAAPAKQTESNYRFEYNSPDFAKLRVTG